MSEPDPTHIWTRAVADLTFRDALIEDPLRASPEQVRQLEEMDRDERAEMVTEIVREVHSRGFQARFGRLRDDGRLGGPDE